MNPVAEDILEHHGILGQKWGLRRYQNPDGTLTELGRQHYRQLYFDENNRLTEYGKKEIQDSIQKRRANDLRILGEEGLKRSDDFDKKRATPEQIERKGDDIIVKQNTQFQRIASPNEPLDSKRKYVSFTKLDNQQYDSMFEMLWTDAGDVAWYEYVNKNPLKVASGEKVVKDVLSKYGDVELSTLYDTFSPYRNKKLEWNSIASEFVDEGQLAVTKGIEKIMKEHSDEIFQDYAKKGYDAIMDIEDWYGEVADFPIIVLNPKSSLKKVSEKKWNER